jgi:signal transduction histidine kinase
MMRTSYEEQLPLVIIIITTAISLAVGFVSLSSGVYIIFQNLLYVPIIIACIFYQKRGLIFTIILSALYIILLTVFAGVAYLTEGLIRVLIIIIIAFVVSLLSERTKGVEETLGKTNEELVLANTTLLGMNERLAGTEEEMRSQLDELITTQQALRDEIGRKTDFVMIASHELRTPLQPALGYLDLLTSDPESFGLSGEVVELLTSCQQNIDRERRIIDRMLELSLVDSGKLKPKFERICLQSFIGDIINASVNRSVAQVKNSIPHEAVLYGDPSQLYQVFANIISNAVRYNDPPREVELTYMKEAEYHRISVTDNGIGIDISSQKKIFEPFHIADLGNLSRKYNRIGLGLPIAQRYAELHGGEITLVSTPGVGSIFTVRLPDNRPD